MSPFFFKQISRFEFAPTLLLIAFALAVSSNAARAQNYSLSFDGSNDYVEITDANFPVGTSPYTIELWVKTSDSTKNFGCFLVYGTNAYYSSGVNASELGSYFGYLHFGRWLYGGQELSTTAYVTDNQWHHIAMTYNGSTTSLYCDGLLAGSITANYPTPNARIRLGISEWRLSYPERYLGLQDELKIWNTCRSQSQIVYDMYDVPPASTPNLVGYWRTNEGSGNTLNNSVTGGANGSIVGPVWSTESFGNGLTVSTSTIMYNTNIPFHTDSTLLYITNPIHLPFRYTTLTGASSGMFTHRVLNTDSLTNSNDSLCIWVYFHPDSLRTYLDTLRLTFESPYNSITIPISGTGRGMNATLPDSVIAFPNVMEPTFCDSLLIHLTVDGNDTLHVATLINVTPFTFNTNSLHNLLPSDTASFWLYFTPTTPGSYLRRLPIIVHTINADTLWLTAIGNSSYLPAAPGNLVMTTQMEDANLTWSQVDTSLSGAPVLVQRYLVYFRQYVSDHWNFLGYTTGASFTSFSHTGVVRHSPGMNYQVTAWIGNSTNSFDRIIRTIPVGTTKEEVEKKIAKWGVMTRCW